MPNVVSQNPPIAVAPVEKKLNAGVLDASRYVRVDFDYPDLDVCFLAMENSATITLNESNFDRELTQDDKPMIVDFWAEWCGPCKMIAPLLDEIAREKAGALQVRKVNVSENQSLSSKYNIRAIPALLFFKNGQLRDQVDRSHEQEGSAQPAGSTGLGNLGAKIAGESPVGQPPRLLTQSAGAPVGISHRDRFPLQPDLLGLSAMISQYFTRRLCAFTLQEARANPSALERRLEWRASPPHWRDREMRAPRSACLPPATRR